MKRITGLLWIFLILIVSYQALAPLLHPGFFPMHDDTQVARVYEMARSLMDGMFPVRWVVDLGYGYGYPIFSFYGPFAYYVGSIFVLLGSSALDATKIMFIIGILLSGIGMYFLCRIFWGSTAGIIGAMLYVYAPYHAVTIYVRGAAGEFYGYALLPFVFYGLIKLYRAEQFRYFLILSLSLAALITAHNLTALMLLPFLILTVIALFIISLRTKRLRAFYQVLGSILIGALLSSFYAIPAVMEMQFTNVLSQVGGGADFREHFVCFSQLWTSMWGFGGSAKGCIDGLSFQIGKVHILLVLAAIVLSFVFVKLHREKFLAASSAFCFLLLSIFLMLPSSQFIWELLPQLAFIQYPWRFLMFASFFASFLGAGVVWYVLSLSNVAKKHFFRVAIAVLFFGVIVVYYGKFFVPQTILGKSSNDYTNSNELRFATSKISDEYLPPNFQKPQDEGEFILKTFSLQAGDAVLLSEINKANKYSLDYRSRVPSTIIAHIAHFPAWEASIDGKKDVPVKEQDSGYIVSVPSGRHLLVFTYKETPVERIGDILSIIGALILLIGIIVTERRGTL